MARKAKVGILGASGYTGADAVRLLARHPNVEITALTANTHAGKAMDEVFPHFFMLDLPRLTEWEKVDWTALDAVFCGLPHGTTQEITTAVLAANPAIKMIDMSADFRLLDMEVYAQWYGHAHRAPQLQQEAVYGLTEFYREKIKATRLVACPGCYPTAVLLALVPLAKAKLIDVDDIVIDAKSGVTGAGRGLKQTEPVWRGGRGVVALFGGEASPFARDRAGDRLGGGRARDGELHAASHSDEPGRALHLLRPARRRERRRPARGAGAGLQGRAVRARRAERAFCRRPRTCAARTMCRSASSADRIKNRAIVIATLDNLVKGSAGQAIQNMNLMLGYPETTGLEQIALFP